MSRLAAFCPRKLSGFGGGKSETAYKWFRASTLSPGPDVQRNRRAIASLTNFFAREIESSNEQARGQTGSDRGRISAAGAVRRHVPHKRSGEFDNLSLVKKKIHGPVPLQMPAFEQDRGLEISSPIPCPPGASISSRGPVRQEILPPRAGSV